MQIEEITRTASYELNIGRSNMATTKLKDYVLFGGGMRYNESIDVEEASNIVDIFQHTGNGQFKQSTAPLSVARSNLAAATVGDYALFGGGKSVEGNSDVVDVFILKNGKFLRTEKLRLSVKRHDISATSLGNYILFAGGLENGDIVSNVVDIFKLEEDGTFSHTTTKLQVGRRRLAAASIGNYAFFGFGLINSGTAGRFETTDKISVFELVDNNIVWKQEFLASFVYERGSATAVVVHNKVLFAGGSRSDIVYGIEVLEDGTIQSLRDNEMPRLHSTIIEGVAGTNIGDYTFFYGGYDLNAYSNSVDIFKLEEDGTFSNTTEETHNKVTFASAMGIGDFVLLAGGKEKDMSETEAPVYSKKVDVFQLKHQEGWNRKTYVKNTPATLSQARGEIAAATVGNYVLFGGGSTESGATNIVDVFKLEEDGTFTKSTATLSVARSNLAAATVGNYVLFAGGLYSDVVDIFHLEPDGTLTKSTDTSLSQARGKISATTVGNYVFFGGGNTGSDHSAVVDVFKLTGTFMGMFLVGISPRYVIRIASIGLSTPGYFRESILWTFCHSSNSSVAVIASSLNIGSTTPTCFESSNSKFCFSVRYTIAVFETKVKTSTTMDLPLRLFPPPNIILLPTVVAANLSLSTLNSSEKYVNVPSSSNRYISTFLEYCLVLVL